MAQGRAGLDQTLCFRRLSHSGLAILLPSVLRNCNQSEAEQSTQTVSSLWLHKEAEGPLQGSCRAGLQGLEGIKSLAFCADILRMYRSALGAHLLSPINNGEPVRPVAFLLKSSLTSTLCASCRAREILEDFFSNAAFSWN